MAETLQHLDSQQLVVDVVVLGIHQLSLLEGLMLVDLAEVSQTQLTLELVLLVQLDKVLLEEAALPMLAVFKWVLVVEAVLEALVEKVLVMQMVEMAELEEFQVLQVQLLYTQLEAVVASELAVLAGLVLQA
jgi:hypothetical protein